MKKTIIATFGMLSIATLSSQAVVLINDNFDAISDGDLTADANWAAFSGGDLSIDVASGVVTGLGSGAEDVERTFADTAGVYFGLDINVSDDANSDYVMGFRDGGAQAARIFLAGDGANIAVGVNSGGSGSASAGATSVATFTLNTTVRIVGFADGNGTVSAWINPSAGDSATPDVTLTNADVGDLTGFYFRQGGSWDNGAAAWTADNLIVSTTFSEALAVPEPSSVALLGLAGLATMFRRKR